MNPYKVGFLWGFYVNPSRVKRLRLGCLPLVHTWEVCVPLPPVPRVHRAAQPGAMGAPSYVQPDHWDQIAHQLLHRSQAPADQLLFAGARFISSKKSSAWSKFGELFDDIKVGSRRQKAAHAGSLSFQMHLKKNQMVMKSAHCLKLRSFLEWTQE